MCVWLVSQSCQALYGLMDWGQPGSSDHGILHARTRVGYLLLLQVVSLTLGFNGASYVSCIDRWILHHQHHLGSLSRGLHSFSFPLVTWVWANPGRQWGTGKPGVLQFMGSQRVRHDLETEEQQLVPKEGAPRLSY